MPAIIPVSPPGTPRGPLHGPERRRQEILERVAVGQQQPPDPFGMVSGRDLRDRAAGVVADERDVLEVESLDEVGDDPGHARGREVGILDSSARDGSPSGRSGTMQRNAVLQQRRHLAPQPAVDEQAVDEDDGRSLAHSRYRMVPWELSSFMRVPPGSSSHTGCMYI